MLYYIFQDIPVHMPSDDVLDLYNDLYLTLDVSQIVCVMFDISDPS